MYNRATELVHHFLSELIEFGDHVVDATCGNGSDTVELLRLVGPSGRVDGFDVQEAAISATKDRLRIVGETRNVFLHHASHSRIKDVLPEASGVKAVVFNLGYLPGSDKMVITQPEDTLAAHRAALDVLMPGGVIFSTVYIGHEGGEEESDRLLEWARSLDPKQYSAGRHQWLNRKNAPPYLLIVQRRS
jgi:SAM-dependent methyltransferase